MRARRALAPGLLLRRSALASSRTWRDAEVLGLRLNGWLAVVHLALGMYLIGMWDTARPGRALAVAVGAFAGLGVLGLADDDGVVGDWLITSTAIGVFDLVLCIVVPMLWIAGPQIRTRVDGKELTGSSGDRHFAPDSDRAHGCTPALGHRCSATFWLRS